VQPSTTSSIGDLDAGSVPSTLDALDEATNRLRTALDDVGEDALQEPSRLEGWSRTTLLAHLRYGATASVRLTEDALAGRPAAFYPGGATEREESLRPGEGESATDLVADLFTQSDRLAEEWRQLDDADWEVELREPKLGRMRLTRAVALRLTEIEVHGVDLGLDGLDEWSDRFVEICLPLRIVWLPIHARNLPEADRTVSGRWLLRSDTGRSWLVSASGALASAGPKDVIHEASVDCVISGSERQLLGLVLGRTPVDDLEVSGNEAKAQAFKAAFPGP
jgi:uncharacterized protein (TIGR03083 family)